MDLALRERTLVFLPLPPDAAERVIRLEVGDIRLCQGTMNVTRSIVVRVRPVQDRIIAKARCPFIRLSLTLLMQWRKRSNYNQPMTGFSARQALSGRRPYWGQAILRKIQYVL